MAAAAPTSPAVTAIREQIKARAARMARVKRLDRLAVAFITLGGMFVIAAVSLIFVFMLKETLPLFLPAHGEARGTVSLAAVPSPEPSATAAPAAPAASPAAPRPPVSASPKRLIVGIDEYQMYFYEGLANGRLAFFKAQDGAFVKQFAVGPAGGAPLTVASRSLLGDYVAMASSDGRVYLRQVHFQPRYENQRLVDLDVDASDQGAVELDAAKRALIDVAYEESDGRKLVAAIPATGDEVLVWQTDDEGAEHRASLPVRPGDTFTRVRIGRSETLVAATEQGNLYHWELSPAVRQTQVVHVSQQPITALELLLGNVTVIVGDAKGALAAWFRVRLREDDPDPQFVEAHKYPGQGSAVSAIGASRRGKTFVTAGEDGSLVVRHLTSERSVVSFPPTGSRVENVLLTPKMDGIVATQSDGRLARYEISVPHPEITWKALFGKVWYEGYSHPEYTWQSTGGTDDFETKFSLVPLVFGTIKGTVYALLFAIPIAVMGALYTAQFMHPSIKAKVKPAVEIMAALPSVVVGFIAGLWLASRIERQIVPALLMMVLLPFFGTMGFLLWDRLPRLFRSKLKPGMEIGVIVPLLLLAGLVAWQAGSRLENGLFGGDFRLWLGHAMGLVYDQRNCLVVGLAMGFAVIPIIFTISEDAFSSVPQHLSAASLALGASRWQTAIRVVLPTASPGIFSAIMIGFGRAIGETMIVLMATGNTPVLDWSIFNGMRTLSANIAVEIPEAPYGGTLYRTLFLAGLLLFLLTFLVNTAAEVMRQRLRRRYRAI